MLEKETQQSPENSVAPRWLSQLSGSTEGLPRGSVTTPVSADVTCLSA